MPENDSLQPNEAPKNRTFQKILFWVIVTVLVAVIIWCLSQIIYKVVTDAQDKGQYDTLASSKDAATTGPRPTHTTVLTEPTTEPTEPTEPDEEPVNPEQPDDLPGLEGMIKEYQAMYTLNNDMVGWIEIPGTAIDYPVVQSPYQTNFYLRRNFYKEKATCGAIYVREKCDVTKPSDNLTLYGHNMANGTMFGHLHKYKEKSFWQENKLVYFDTLYEYHTYEIFAVFRTTADLSKGFSYHTFDDAADEAAFNAFVNECKRLSMYNTGITPVYGEKLITLSTCDRSITDGRLVVVARRVM